jgi:hypothetical protein
MFCDFFLLTSLPFTIEAHVESDRKIVALTRASSLLNAKGTDIISMGVWRELIYQQESYNFFKNPALMFLTLSHNFLFHSILLFHVHSHKM